MLANMFSPKELLSVEIGGEYLKLAHIKKSGSGVRVLKMVSKDIRPLSDDEISEFIKNYVAENQIKTKKVITFISPRYTINKNIELPSTNEAEIKEIINLQASRHTPYSRDEIVIDYIPIGVIKGGYTKVLLVIVNKDIIKKYQDILERTGLELTKVVLGKEIICRWFQELRGAQQEPVCLLHVDYAGTDFLVVQDGKVIFARNIPIGAYQLNYEGPAQQERFLKEIQSSLESYQVENVDKFKRVVMVGAVDKLAELPKVLGTQFGFSVMNEPYFDRASFMPEVQSVKEADSKEMSYLPALYAPLCYQLNDFIDLTPEDIRLREIMAEKSRDLIFTATLVMFILIVGSFVLYNKITTKQTTLKSFVGIYEKEHQDALKLKEFYKQTGVIKRYLDERTFALEVITEMYRLAPKTVWLNNISYVYEKDNRNLKLDGSGESLADIQRFIDSLKESPFFEVDKATKNMRGELYDFEVVCLFKKNKAVVKAEK
ncbi:MAG: pilus assembly protein PilM [Planctomycetes bacterium]|nr:pilus assembly protein PilM [Planctomycetota bacterium]